MVNPPHLDDVYISIECNIFYKFLFFLSTHVFPSFSKGMGKGNLDWYYIVLEIMYMYIQKCICLYTLYWVILPPGFFGMFQFKKFKQIRMLVMSKIVNQKKNALLMFNALLPCSQMQNFSEYVDVYIIQLRYMYIVSIEHLKKFHDLFF